MGGECSYWGCIPSKTLIRPGDVLAAARRVPGAAEAVTGNIDVAAALAQRDYMTSGWNDESQLAWLAGKEIEFVRGSGRLVGERAVEVDRSDGGTCHIEATTAVVLATGTGAVIPPVPGLADIEPWDNRVVHRGQGRCRAACSCSAVAPSGWRWPRPSGASAARR